MKASAVHCTAVVVAEGSVIFFLLRLGQEPVPGRQLPADAGEEEHRGKLKGNKLVLLLLPDMDESDAESRIIRPPA
jgi:hypothetical protein